MPHVVVIGAGVAGLTVAKELSHINGFKVSILEATGRIGGRVKAVEVGNVHVDLGASWMHETRVNPLFAEALKHQWPIKHTDVVTKYFTERGEIPKKAGVHQIVREIESWVSEYFHQEKPLLDPEPSLKEFVQQRVLKSLPLVSDQQKAWAELTYRLVEHFVGQKWADIPAGEGGEQSPLGRDVFMLGRGYEQVVEWITSHSNKENIQILMNEEVTRIDLKTTNDWNSFEISTPDAKYHADYIVCTIPLGALKRNTSIFDSLRPYIQPVLDTIEATDIAALGKVIVRFPSVWWDTEVDVFGVANEKTGDLVSIINPYGDCKDPEPVLVALTGPDLTQRVEADPSNAYETLKWAFRAIAPGEINEPLEVLVTDWTQSKYFGCSYSARSINQSYDDQTYSFIDGIGNLRFAGEHTTLEGNGCVHGAYLSGLREAKRIEGRNMAKWAGSVNSAK